MRPERLKIQAFGSFADLQEIDFTQFGDNPMILINGPTGAGKSTILDAICFALYGQASGDDRDPSQMRAQHANASDLSEIEFQFSLGSASYRIRRVPQQKRPKKRGEGETEHNAEAQVWKLDGEDAQVVVNRGMAQATDYIESLMGLNADQFRQVMVLPQGKFRELLVAKSTEREKIFSTLFNSAIYKRIEDSLKAQAKIVRDQVQSSVDQAAGKLKMVGMESEQALTEAIDQLRPVVSQLDTNRTHASKQLAQSTKTLDNARILVKAFETAEQLSQKLGDLEDLGKDLAHERRLLKKASAAIRLLPEFQMMERTKLGLQGQVEKIEKQAILVDDAITRQKHVKASFLAVSKKVESAESDKKTLNDLEQFVKLHDGLLPRIEAVKVSTAKHVEALNNHKKIRDALVDAREQLNQLEQTLEKDRGAVDQLNALQLSVASLESTVVNRKNYDNNISEQQQLVKQCDDVVPIIKAQKDKLEADAKRLLQLELEWHRGAAATLAAQLETELPCPVCGSKEHPHPATAENDRPLVDHTQIEHARQRVDEQRHELQKRQSEMAKWREQSDRLKMANESLVQANSTLPETTLAALQKQLRIDQTTCKKLQEVKASLPKAESSVQSLRQQVSALETDLVKAVASESEASAILKTSNSEYEKALSAIPDEFQSRDVLQDKIDAIGTSIEQTAKEYADSERQLQSVNLELTKYTSALSTLETELHTQRKQLEAFEGSWREQLAHSVFTDDEDFRKSCLSEDQANDIRRKLEEHEKLLNNIRGERDASLKLLESKVPPDITALTSIVTQATIMSTSADEQWQKERDRLKQLEDVQKSLSHNMAETASLRDEYETLGRLSSVAAGQSETRVSLQRFVLSVLLDDVLIDATKRMRIMSRNRYQLVRREVGGGRQAAGLELDVFDTYSGKTRPVSTLSGGESFQAALSLALGLSDVVQSYSGGIRLDTLFIDEGFGSLDTDALELAIKTLTDLQSAGRTIGVISHVTEMKEQINQRLDIRPSPTGSKIYAVT